MPYSNYLKTNALHFHSQGLSLGVITKILKDEGLSTRPLETVSHS